MLAVADWRAEGIQLGLHARTLKNDGSDTEIFDGKYVKILCGNAFHKISSR
jgi:hypothetical protein